LLGASLITLGRRLIQVPLRLVTLGFAFRKLTLRIGNDLLWIVQAVIAPGSFTNLVGLVFPSR
jgi:hypothetical protein